VVTSISNRCVRVQVAADQNEEADNAYKRSCKGRVACKRSQLGGVGNRHGEIGESNARYHGCIPYRKRISLIASNNRWARA